MTRVREILLVLSVFAVVSVVHGQDTSNAITRSEFNFGHQLGYMYSRVGDAYFQDGGIWRFETGFLTLYTSDMPLVRSSHWKERTFMFIPLYFEIYPSDNIALEIEMTDLFIELPYYDIHSMGGKSPRFKTKMRLVREGRWAPAVAFTAGVKFSSAKPWVIWRHDHNYDESNGLTGAGTGVADYILLFTLSKKLGVSTSLHTHFGLIPIGSPVEYKRGSAQADEIPLGISLRHDFTASIEGTAEAAGMASGLSSTKLANYAVVRGKIAYRYGCNRCICTVEHGLTQESDEWGAGITGVFEFGRTR